MTCKEVNSYLDRPRQDPGWLPGAVQSHLEACTPCRSLRDFLTRSEALQHGETDRTAQIEAEILGSLSPVEPLPGTAKLTAGFLFVFVLLTATLVWFVGADGAASAPPLRFVALLGCIGAIAFLVAIVLGREMAPGERRWLPAMGQLAVMLAALLAAAAVIFPWELGEDFAAHNCQCFRAGLLMSVPAVAVIILILRRGAVLWLCAAGAAAGVFAGLMAMTVLHFACSNYYAPHIALSHLGLPVAGGLIGFALGRMLPFLPGGFGSPRKSA